MPEPKAFFLTETLHRYIVEHSDPPDDLLRELTEETWSAIPDRAMMQIAPDQGAFLTILARVANARFAVEVGTFTGYSSICIARGLNEGGRLLCCDVSDEWTAIARRYWERAGIADRIELRIAPAIETLKGLPPQPNIDFAFIDADKPGYIAYYEELVPRLLPNGVLLADNVLWDGNVADPSKDDENTRAIRAFNDHVARDTRVDTVMLAVADGLTLVRKR